MAFEEPCVTSGQKHNANVLAVYTKSKYTNLFSVPIPGLLMVASNRVNRSRKVAMKRVAVNFDTVS